MTRSAGGHAGAMACACGALVAVALLLAIAGCARRPPAVSYAPGYDVGGTPRRGGHAIFVREEDPDYLDPALSYGVYTAPLVNAVFHTLLDYVNASGPAGNELVPDLAESLPELREDGTLYCFKVRQDARFGAPLRRHITAADFKYAIERLFKVSSPGVDFYRPIVGSERMLKGQDSTLAGVIARGDSLYVRIGHRDPVFLHILAMTFTSPVPREVAERYPHAFSQHTVATGPFQIAEFTPRRRVVLVRNPDYCGTPAYLDTFELRLGINATSGVAQIRRGDVDGGIFELPAGDFVRLRQDSVWRHQIVIRDGLNTEYLYLNCSQKPFDDVRVRQAVAWAIDRRALVKMYSGKATPAGEFLPLGMPGAVPLGRYQGPDRDQARALLREAGYPNGLHTKLYGWMAEPGPRELTLIQQQLAEVGIHAELDLGETAGYTQMAAVRANHIPFGIYSWYADYVDPSNFFDTLLNGDRITDIHNNNLSVFDDAVTNRMIEQAMHTADDSTRTHLWQAVDRRVMDLCPIVTTVHLLDSRLVGLRIGGYVPHLSKILKLESLYLKTPLAAPVAAREPRP